MSGPAGCAAPTCTSPRATCRRAGPASCPATRSSAGGALGGGADRFALGDRVGVAWLRHTGGACRCCRRGAENLCPASRYTGWDADGGYAEYTVGAGGVRLPAARRAVATSDAAPLLCAGIIGYRALRRAELPPGGRLGIYGFGGSAHLTAQIALAQGAERARAHPRRAPAAGPRLGAASVGGAYDAPPVPLDAAILFAPVGELVPVALRPWTRAAPSRWPGSISVDIPALDYQRAPVPGAAAAQRHGQHPAGRRGVPPAGRAAAAPGDHDAGPAG